MTASVSRGSRSLWAKVSPPPSGCHRGSRSRWMVEASAPQVSESRLAARPVGGREGGAQLQMVEQRQNAPERGGFFRCPARR